MDVRQTIKIKSTSIDKPTIGKWLLRLSNYTPCYIDTKEYPELYQLVKTINPGPNDNYWIDDDPWVDSYPPAHMYNYVKLSHNLYIFTKQFLEDLLVEIDNDCSS